MSNIIEKFSKGTELDKGLTRAVHDFSGASKEALRAGYSTVLVQTKEEMGFNEELARGAYEFVNGESPSPAKLAEMRINAEASTKLPHPEWTYSNTASGNSNTSRAMLETITQTVR